MPGPFSANPQFLGYLYQARYALLMLIESGENDLTIQMSIERFDDVSLDKDGKPTHQIQTKHHLDLSASLGDASPDLWKTIRVWSASIIEGQASSRGVVRTIVTTARANDASIAGKLRPRQLRGRSAEIACTALRSIAQTSANKANESAYRAFLQLSKRQQLELVKSINVLDSAPLITDVKEKVLRKLRLGTSASNLERLYERLEGWWFDVVVRHLIGSSADPIAYSEIWSKINDIRSQLEPDNLPIDFPRPVKLDEADFQSEERMFIEQLRLVSVQPDRVQKAMSDYYRAYRQRSRWVRESLLYVDELERYEEILVDEWDRQRDELADSYESCTSEESLQRLGRHLFFRIDGTNITIRSRCADSYVSRGSYHILSNQLRIGWHPHYVERLRHQDVAESREYESSELNA